MSNVQGIFSKSRLLDPETIERISLRVIEMFKQSLPESERPSVDRAMELVSFRELYTIQELKAENIVKSRFLYDAISLRGHPITHEEIASVSILLQLSSFFDQEFTTLERHAKG